MVKDYKGREFESYKQMAVFYHVPYKTFLSRKKENWSLEECLTGKKTKRKSSVDASKRTDHLGRVYPTVEDMCEAWGVSVNNYDTRRHKGYSLEECLTGIKKRIIVNNIYEVKDHLGNKFESILKMCEYYNVPYCTYKDRQKKGLSIEECLADYVPVNFRCKDHLGNEFNSIKEMCEHWNIRTGTYRQRRRNGWSIEDCLTMKSKSGSSSIVTDHLGNKFRSQQDLCKFYNIPYYIYYSRVHNGWPQEKALTTKFEEANLEESRTDHLGNQFNSVEEMCKHYGITKVLYKGRIRRKWTKERALTTPIADGKDFEGRVVPEEDRTDHKGNVFNSRIEMVKFYECELAHFYHRMRKGKTKDEILRECEDRMNRRRIAENNWIVDNLIYTSPDGVMYYICHRKDGTEEVLSVDEAKAM